MQQQLAQLQQQDEQLQQANQQLVLQRQQLQRRLAESEQALAQSERCCAAAVARAESAEAELSGIRQDVAEWSELHVVESCELQETWQKLADAETDLGVALQRMAACGLQARRSGNSGGAAQFADVAAAAGVRPGSSSGSPCRRDGSGPGRSIGAALGGQQLPLEVTRQLQWQASEVVRLTGQLQQLQVSGGAGVHAASVQPGRTGQGDVRLSTAALEMIASAAAARLGLSTARQDMARCSCQAAHCRHVAAVDS